MKGASFEEIVEDLVALNPHCTAEELMGKAEFEADGVTLKNWDLFDVGLVALPESFGSLTMVGTWS